MALFWCYYHLQADNKTSLVFILFLGALSMYLKLVVTSIIFSLLVGCSSLGQIKTTEILVKDASNLSSNDLSVLGSEEVISTRLKVMHQGETLTINLYKPVRNILKGPSVVFCLAGWQVMINMTVMLVC